MKTILVPTDFSKNAENALDYAISFVGKEQAKIILLFAYQIMYADSDFQVGYSFEQRFYIEKNANDNLLILSEKVRKNSNIECVTISHEGFVVDAILDTAEKQKIDFIIMGTKGASGVKAVLLGSTTAKVINRTTKSLIAVPEKATFHIGGKIVFATDYKANDLKALEKLVAITRMKPSEINIVHIVTGVNDYLYEDACLKKFETKVSKKIAYKPITYSLVYGEDVEEKLEKYIKKEKAGMIALSTKNKGVFQRIFGKSVTKKMAYHTRIPLIVFHA